MTMLDRFRKSWLAVERSRGLGKQSVQIVEQSEEAVEQARQLLRDIRDLTERTPENSA